MLAHEIIGEYILYRAVYIVCSIIILETSDSDSASNCSDTSQLSRIRDGRDVSDVSSILSSSQHDFHYRFEPGPTV